MIAARDDQSAYPGSDGNDTMIGFPEFGVILTADDVALLRIAGFQSLDQSRVTAIGPAVAP